MGPRPWVAAIRAVTAAAGRGRVLLWAADHVNNIIAVANDTTRAWGVEVDAMGKRQPRCSNCFILFKINCISYFVIGNCGRVDGTC